MARRALDLRIAFLLFMQTQPFHHAPCPALVALRQATAGHHQAIESVTRLDGDWDLFHYQRVLWGFDHYLRAWEPHVLAALPTHLREGFAARSRRGFLRADLAALGGPPVDAPSAPAPTLPELPSTAAAMGSLYVLEGSALGGQLIARRLRQQHGLAEQDGGAYFNGWGPRTGAMWQQFRAQLEGEVGDDPVAIDEACRAAVQTFEGLTRSFEVMLHEHANG